MASQAIGEVCGCWDCAGMMLLMDFIGHVVTAVQPGIG